MTAISSYYAQVGIKLNRQDIGQVKKYLDSISRLMQHFQNRVYGKGGKKSLDLSVGAKFGKGVTKSLQKELLNLSKGLTLTISNVRVSQAALNSALGKTRQTAVVRNVSTNIGQGGGSKDVRTVSPRSRRKHSPWHNPMMLGGSLGAFMRYGPYSLPLVAGAMGLNSLSQGAENLQNAQMSIRAQMNNPDLAKTQMSFLNRLGDVHGVRMQDMAPAYSQMFAAAQGTSIESFIPQGFQNFLQYASVTGLNSEQKKGAMLALSQIIGKGGKGFAQELNLQLVNQGMPNARRLFADAVAGGDLAKFEDMMAKGQVGLEGVQKFLELLGTRAAPFLDDFYQSITRNKGTAKKAGEDWMAAFMQGGGAGGISEFYKVWTQITRDSLPYASTIGDIFSRASAAMQVAFLVPGEIVDWLKGGKDNFMQSLFGDADDSAFTTSIVQSFKTISDSFKSSVDTMTVDLTGITSALTLMSNILALVIDTITAVIRQIDAFDKGGFAGMRHELQRGDYQSKARRQAKLDLDNSGMEYDSSDVDSVARAYMMGWDAQNPAPKNAPPGTQKVWGGALSEGYFEISEMLNSGKFSAGGLWEVLNKDRSSLAGINNNTPASVSPDATLAGPQTNVSGVSINITMQSNPDQDDIEIAENIGKEVEKSFSRILIENMKNNPYAAGF